LGFRPSEGLFVPALTQLSIEKASYVAAQGNLSMVITAEGELLYMG
jgi:hypothetical protein